ncbi:hypothetical protein EZS27_025977, partial [termite gut metagenome]
KASPYGIYDLVKMKVLSTSERIMIQAGLQSTASDNGGNWLVKHTIPVQRTFL